MEVVYEQFVFVVLIVDETVGKCLCRVGLSVFIGGNRRTTE